MHMNSASDGYEERHLPIRQRPPAQKPSPKNDEDEDDD